MGMKYLSAQLRGSAARSIVPTSPSRSPLAVADQRLNLDGFSGRVGTGERAVSSERSEADDSERFASAASARDLRSPQRFVGAASTRRVVPSGERQAGSSAPASPTPSERSPLKAQRPSGPFPQGAGSKDVRGPRSHDQTHQSFATVEPSSTAALRDVLARKDSSEERYSASRDESHSAADSSATPLAGTERRVPGARDERKDSASQVRDIDAALSKVAAWLERPPTSVAQHSSSAEQPSAAEQRGAAKQPSAAAFEQSPGRLHSPSPAALSERRPPVLRETAPSPMRIEIGSIDVEVVQQNPSRGSKRAPARSRSVRRGASSLPFGWRQG